MKATGRKQLNIRSDEAYRLAHEIARKRGITTTRVVEDALRSLQESVAEQDVFSEAAVREREARFRTLARDLRKAAGSDTSERHDDLYDAFGLPK